MTTLGRGGSDLTATTIGKALGLREIQVSVEFFMFCMCILLMQSMDINYNDS